MCSQAIGSKNGHQILHYLFFLIKTFYFVLEDSQLTMLLVVSGGHQSIPFSKDIYFPHINHKAL